MTSQVDTLDLLRAHPHSTVAELAEIMVPNGGYVPVLRAKNDLQTNLTKLRRKGEVTRSEDRPYRWLAMD